MDLQETIILTLMKPWSSLTNATYYTYGDVAALWFFTQWSG